MKRTMIVAVLTTIALVLAAAPVEAAPIRYDVSLDTSSLVGAAGGPFALSFQLVDGGGTATSSVLLSGFAFGGSGGPLGAPTFAGGASGDLSGDVTLTDAGPVFFTEFIQSFTAGPLLTFTIFLTPGLESGGIPDQFSMGILRGSGAGIPTAFFDAFLLIDIDSRAPKAKTFASDPSSGYRLGPPTVSSVPEPATLVLFGIAVAAGLGRRRTRSHRD